MKKKGLNLFLLYLFIIVVLISLIIYLCMKRVSMIREDFSLGIGGGTTMACGGDATRNRCGYCRNMKDKVWMGAGNKCTCKFRKGDWYWFKAMASHGKKNHIKCIGGLEVTRETLARSFLPKGYAGQMLGGVVAVKYGDDIVNKLKFW